MRVLFSRNFACAKFSENKILTKISEITLSFTGIGKSHFFFRIFIAKNMCFKAICKNKILAKITDFTVFSDQFVCFAIH